MESVFKSHCLTFDEVRNALHASADINNANDLLKLLSNDEKKNLLDSSFETLPREIFDRIILSLPLELRLKALEDLSEKEKDDILDAFDCIIRGNDRRSLEPDQMLTAKIVEATLRGYKLRSKMNHTELYFFNKAVITDWTEFKTVFANIEEYSQKHVGQVVLVPVLYSKISCQWQLLVFQPQNSSLYLFDFAVNDTFGRKEWIPHPKCFYIFKKIENPFQSGLHVIQLARHFMDHPDCDILSVQNDLCYSELHMDNYAIIRLLGLNGIYFCQEDDCCESYDTMADWEKHKSECLHFGKSSSGYGNDNKLCGPNECQEPTEKLEENREDRRKKSPTCSNNLRRCSHSEKNSNEKDCEGILPKSMTYEENCLSSFTDSSPDERFLSWLLQQADYHVILREEKYRKKTFYDRSWKRTPIDENDYAKAGFYFSGRGNIIKCPFCNLEVKCTKIPCSRMGKKLPLLHALLSVGCKGVSVPSNQQRSMAQPMQALPLPGYETQPLNSIVYFREDDRKNAFDVTIFGDRVRTFKMHPRQEVEYIQSMAEAGFYHTPTISAPDKVTCFWCNGSLENWDHDDKPWDEHAKFFPGCSYLRQIKGTNYILRVRNSMNPAVRDSQRLDYNGSGTILSLDYCTNDKFNEREKTLIGFQNAGEFAGLGFHKADGSSLMCYFCGFKVCLNSTFPEVELIHEQQSPYCNFCKLRDVDAAHPTEGPEGVMNVMQLWLDPCGHVIPDHSEAEIRECPEPFCGAIVERVYPLHVNMGNS